MPRMASRVAPSTESAAVRTRLESGPRCRRSRIMSSMRTRVVSASSIEGKPIWPQMPHMLGACWMRKHQAEIFRRELFHSCAVLGCKFVELGKVAFLRDEVNRGLAFRQPDLKVARRDQRPWPRPPALQV